MTERERRIAAKAADLERDLVDRLQRGDELDGVDRLLLVCRGVGLRAMRRPGEPVELTAAEVAILAEGAAATLLAWAESDIDGEAERTAVLERTLASKPPTILH